MSGQITVNPDALQTQEVELSNLLVRLQNRKLRNRITVSKGSIAEATQGSIDFLNQVSSELETLVMNTYKAVKLTRLEFVKTDQNVSNHFNGTEK